MSARRAVAIVRHSYYPFELNVKREAEALRDAGFDVHVLCLRGPGEAASAERTISGPSGWASTPCTALTAAGPVAAIPSEYVTSSQSCTMPGS